jgi:hypothetical protein
MSWGSGTTKLSLHSEDDPTRIPSGTGTCPAGGTSSRTGRWWRLWTGPSSRTSSSGTGLDRGAAQLRRRRPPVCSTSATAWESPRAATASSGPSTASCSSGSGHRRPPGPARARPVVSCPLSLKWDLHGCAYPLSAKWDPYCTSETHADGRAWWWCIA